jgi:hypothetical protein
VVEELAHLVDLDAAAQRGRLDGVGEILAVLAARRVRLYALVAIASRRVWPSATADASASDVRHPVAVAPVHGQVEAAGRELGIQCRLQLAVVLVDRRHPAEVTVVVRDLFEALVGDAAAGRDVAQERDDVVLTLGTAEAEQQHTVIRRGRRDVRRSRRRRSRRATHGDVGHPSRTAAALARGGFGGTRRETRHPPLRCSAQPSVQHLRQLGDLDAPARVERHLLAHMATGARRAQVAHHVDEVDGVVALERQQPLVVAETEGRDGVGDDLRKRAPLRPCSASMLERSSSGSRYHS